MTAAINTDLSYANGLPGTYIKLDLSGSGGTSDDTLKRMLILANGTSAATGALDAPTLSPSQSFANTFGGQGSDLARHFAAAQSQTGPGGCDIYLCRIAANGAASSRYQLVGSFSSGSTAASAGVVNIWIAGHRASANIFTGDDLADIATAIKTEIDKLLDAPVTAALATSATANDTLNLTYRVVGAHGEDLPIRVEITGSSNYRLAVGYDTSATLVFATSSAAAGYVELKIGETTITSTISGIETSATIATNLITAVNAGGYPVTALTAGASKVDLFYASGRDVRRVTCRVVKTNGTANDTTVNGVAAGTAATIGTATSNTPGAGAPTLTTALTNIAALPAFGAWVTPFSDTTTLGTIATHLAAQGDGYKQKDQVLFVGSAAALATAGAIPTGTSPPLTAAPDYCLAWQAGAAVQAGEIAARMAAIYLSENYVAQNLDGKPLVSKASTVPLLTPHVAVRPGDDDQNAALMTYYLTPIVVNDGGSNAIRRAVTTSSSANPDLHELPVRKQLAYGRIQLRQRLTALFQGKNFKALSEPKTPNCFTTENVRTAIFEFLKQLDDQDLFDGAVAVKDAITVSQNQTVRTRLDVFVPWSVIRAIHQIGAVISPQ